MLSPDMIQKKEFEQSVLGGYRRDEVDAFLDEVEADYRKLYEENKDLIEKLKACLSKIEDYKKDEDFLKSAIINAQRLNETTLKEIELREKEVEVSCKEKAAEIISDAEAQAAAIIEKAEKESADAVKAAREQSKVEIEAEQKKCDDEVKMIRAAVEAEQKKLDYLRKQVGDFKTTILDIYRAHVTSISKLPDFSQPAEAEMPVEKEVVAEKKDESLRVAEDIKPIEAPDIVKPVAEKAIEEIPEKDIADDNTVEFKIEEKQSKVKEEAPKAAKFDKLKFGVDYNINDDDE